jgi:hypothetical protein
MQKSLLTVVTFKWHLLLKELYVIEAEVLWPNCCSWFDCVVGLKFQAGSGTITRRQFQCPHISSLSSFLICIHWMHPWWISLLRTTSGRWDRFQSEVYISVIETPPEFRWLDCNDTMVAHCWAEVSAVQFYFSEIFCRMQNVSFINRQKKECRT